MAELTAAQIEAERVKFEAAIGSPPFECSVDRFPDDDDNFAWPGSYRDIAVDLAWQLWLERASEVADQGVTRPAAPGWKLVPIEPTEEMWTAGREPVLYRDMQFKVPPSMEAPPWRINPSTGKVELDQSKGTTAVHVWRAMLAAAPSLKGVL